MRRLQFTALVVTFFSFSAFASDRETSVDVFREYIYRYGTTPTLDDAKTIQSLVDKGSADPVVLYFLYKIYNWGMLEEPAKDRGIKLLSESAERGCSLAKVELSRLYRSGIRIPPDGVTADKLLDDAVAKGEPAAIAELGTLKLIGVDGHPQDIVKARELLAAAVENGFQPAVADLATAEHAAGHTDAARIRLELASKSNNARAKLVLGEWYRRGVAVARDDKVAFNLIRSAAEAGEVDALKPLADMLLAGEGTNINESRAAKYYLLSAGNGNRDAALELARCLLVGRGVEMDVPHGLGILRKLHSSGMPEATEMLGVAHIEGLWVERDLAKAEILLTEAKTRGRQRANVYLKWIEVARKPKAPENDGRERD